VIVLLLIIVVPSVLARPRMKTPAEIEAETAHQLALIVAKNKIRGAQLGGWKEALGAVTGRAEVPLPDAYDARTDELPMRAPTNEPSAPKQQGQPMTKRMWDAVTFKTRVLQSGLITAAETAEVLGVGPSQARKVIKEVRDSVGEEARIPGRTGVPYQALIDALYARKTTDGVAQAKKLERALGLNKTRALHAVTDAGDNPTVPLASDDEALG